MSVYRITGVGFDNSEAIFFRTTIEMASGYDIAKWLWVGDQDADVILVNSDQEESTSKFDLDKPGQVKTRPILVACSSKDHGHGSFAYTLEKPITYSMITALLLKLQAELSSVVQISSLPPSSEQPEKHKEVRHTEVQSKEKQHSHASFIHPVVETLDSGDQTLGIDDDSDFDIYEDLMDSEFDSFHEDLAGPESESIHEDLVDPESESIKPKADTTPPATYNRPFPEQRRLLGLIRKHVSQEQEQPVEITHYSNPPIRIYPDQQVFAHRTDHEITPDLFTAQVAGFSIHELAESVDQTPPAGWKTQPLWLLFYLATLYGSEGRLKESHNFNDRLSLTSKPDFDVVPNALKYMEIADYMINKEPQDVSTIAIGSSVDVNTVINFCNACEEIDILERTPSTQAETELSSEISPQQDAETKISDKYGVVSKGLLKRFMSRFKHT